MVQTEAQYKFVYLALQRYIQGEQLSLRKPVGAGPGRGDNTTGGEQWLPAATTNIPANGEAKRPLPSPADL